MRSSLFAFVVVLLLWTCGSAAAQDNNVIQEPWSPEFSGPETDQNVVRQALLKQGSGERQLKVAEDLEQKIADEPDARKRAKLEKKLRKAREAAVSDFREALSYNSKMVEAWAGLGTAYREKKEYTEALQAFSEGSKLDPSDESCFVGWAETLLDGQLFGNLVAAHGQLAAGNPPRAAQLLEIARSWLVDRKSDPGDVTAADLGRLEEWVQKQQSSP